MTTSISNTPKTTVFNLIILDESGSMQHLTDQTIAGCNETLNIIRSSAKKNTETIRSLVSIYAFQSEGELPSRYLIKHQAPEDVKNITREDYQPWGNTPLFDAVGSTLSELKAVAATHEDATGIVTIITDGYENSSRLYNPKQVVSLINELKAAGWTINIIGANVDIDQMAKSMSIDNRMSFSASQAGTKAMFNRMNANLDCRMNELADEDVTLSKEARIHARMSSSKTFFKK